MPRVDKTGHAAPRPELIAGFYCTPGCRDFASRVNAQNGGLKPLVHICFSSQFSLLRYK
jgi:hypothetical protein